MTDQEVLLPTREGTEKAIAQFERDLAHDRDYLINCLPGAPGVGMGGHGRAVIVDAITSGAIQHLRDLAEHPVLLEATAQLNTDLRMGDEGFGTYASTLYSHIRELFTRAKNAGASTTQPPATPAKKRATNR